MKESPKFTSVMVMVALSLVKVALQQTVAAAAGKLLLEYWASSHHCLGWAAGTYHSLN